MIPVRDDSNKRSSLSNVERDFLLSSSSAACGNKNNKRRSSRIDGRSPEQVRSHSIQLARWDNGSSATVTWGSGAVCGSTRVACTCTGSVVPPPGAERPNEGAVAIGVDLSPSASTSFRNAQPQWNTPQASGGGPSSNIPSDSARQKLLSNQILRGLERIVLMSGTIDAEALCVVPGRYVWKLQLVVTVVDASGGNLFDACTASCIAALRHYRLPHLDLGGGSEGTNILPKLIGADYKEPTPLPLHHVPLSASFALIQHGKDSNNSSKGDTSSSSSSAEEVSYVIDPNSREEMVAVGCLAIAMNAHGEICYFDFGGGGCELGMREIKDCHDVAFSAVKRHCLSLEETLKEADEESKVQRLQRLQQQQQQQQQQQIPGGLPPPPTTFDKEPPSLDGIPYFAEQEEPMVVEQQQQQQPEGQEAAADAARRREEEELYRRRALDYNVGHRATQLKPDETSATNDNKRASSADAAANQIHDNKNSLLEAMLQSVLTTGGASASITSAAAAERKKNESAAVAVETLAPPPPVEPEPMVVEHDAGNRSKVKPPKKKGATKEEAKKTAVGAAADNHRLDSDEEETTLQLTSEYAGAGAAAAEKAVAVQAAASTDTTNNAQANENHGDDDVDDLAAAIKTKKKKKSKKKK